MHGFKRSVGGNRVQTHGERGQRGAMRVNEEKGMRKSHGIDQAKSEGQEGGHDYGAIGGLPKNPQTKVKPRDGSIDERKRKKEAQLLGAQ